MGIPSCGRLNVILYILTCILFVHKNDYKKKDL